MILRFPLNAAKCIAANYSSIPNVS